MKAKTKILNKLTGINVIAKPPLPIVIDTLGGGLGNRIKCMLAGLRADPEAKFIWNRIVHFDCQLHDLFAEDLETTQKAGLNFAEKNWASWRLQLFEDDPLHPNMIRPLSHCHVTGTPGYRPLRPYTASGLDGIYDHMPEVYRSQILRLMPKLRPQADIIELAENLVRDFDQNTVSVHYRTFYDHPARARHMGDLTYKFYRAMDAIDHANFFVCTDSEETTQKFIKRYGKQIVGVGSPPKAKGVARAKHDFASLLALGKADTMIVTDGSSFTEAGWYYGGCKAKVIQIRASGIRMYFRKIWGSKFNPN